MSQTVNTVILVAFAIIAIQSFATVFLVCVEIAAAAAAATAAAAVLVVAVGLAVMLLLSISTEQRYALVITHHAITCTNSSTEGVKGEGN